MKKLDELKKHLRPGQVYRREDLAKWSNAVDRHINELMQEGYLTKISGAGGMYYRPKESVWGKVPPSQQKLVKAFLKDDRFLLTSFNEYNGLGVGTTQLYNQSFVYNHKRHGDFELGGRRFTFVLKPHFPKQASVEFLLVDLVNNVSRLAEDHERVLNLAKQRAQEMDAYALRRAAHKYGTVRTRKFFDNVLTEVTAHAA